MVGIVTEKLQIYSDAVKEEMILAGDSEEDACALQVGFAVEVTDHASETGLKKIIKVPGYKMDVGLSEIICPTAGLIAAVTAIAAKVYGPVPTLPRAARCLSSPLCPCLCLYLCLCLCLCRRLPLSLYTSVSSWVSRALYADACSVLMPSMHPKSQANRRGYRKHCQRNRPAVCCGSVGDRQDRQSE